MFVGEKSREHVLTPSRSIPVHAILWLLLFRLFRDSLESENTPGRASREIFVVTELFDFDPEGTGEVQKAGDRRGAEGCCNVLSRLLAKGDLSVLFECSEVLRCWKHTQT